MTIRNRAPALVALLVLAAAPARAQCPASSARCHQDLYAPTGPTFSILCEDVVMQTSWANFDAPHAKFSAASDASQGAEVTLADAFTVNGPLAGSAVGVHVRVRFHGLLGNFGGPTGSHAVISAAAAPALPGDPPASLRTFDAPGFLSGVVTYADSLDLVLSRTAGTPFGLAFHALADVGGYDTVVDATFTFLDLPPGASVTSCKGYAQDQPVPAAATSWGRLKAAYR